MNRLLYEKLNPKLSMYRFLIFLILSISFFSVEALAFQETPGIYNADDIKDDIKKMHRRSNALKKWKWTSVVQIKLRCIAGKLSPS